MLSYTKATNKRRSTPLGTPACFHTVGLPNIRTATAV